MSTAIPNPNWMMLWVRRMAIKGWVFSREPSVRNIPSGEGILRTLHGIANAPEPGGGLVEDYLAPCSALTTMLTGSLTTIVLPSPKVICEPPGIS